MSALCPTAFFIETLRKPEIGDLRLVVIQCRQSIGAGIASDCAASSTCQKNIGGLQIPVNDAALMCEVNRPCEGLNRFGSWPKILGLAAQAPAQAAPLDEFEQK